MKRLGRDKTYFRFNTKESLATHYYKQAEHGITKIKTKNNYFMEYILTGIMKLPVTNHPYLDERNFLKLKKRTNKVVFINESVSAFLAKTTDNTFDKYNLSDIFEMMSQKEYEDIFMKIEKTAKKSAILCYWNNLVVRTKHPLVKNIVMQPSMNLQKKDRVFFYSKFIVEKKLI
jgi:S-adenosylmethionine-diacylglycerol 3-amino-3-carboxypropyl transferase